jgi:hypothetical protein
MLQSSSGNFHGIFMIFRVFFVPLKQFLDYLELFLALKNKFEKKEKKTILLERAEPEGPTRSGPPAPALAQPQARRGPSRPKAATPLACSHGRRWCPWRARQAAGGAPPL